MALRLDHLTLIAPSLAEGVEHVRVALGVAPPPGGKHPLMGTHNHLLRLGDAQFLEVIAVDPDAPAPQGRRWFGLDDAAVVRRRWDAGCRLNGWVASSDDLAGALRLHGDLFGVSTTQTRGALSWQFAVRPDGALAMDGALPSLMEWPDHRGPASSMPDLGCSLQGFVITHPQAERAQAILADLGFTGGVEWRSGPQPAFEALIATPAGLRRI